MRTILRFILVLSIVLPLAACSPAAGIPTPTRDTAADQTPLLPSPKIEPTSQPPAPTSGPTPTMAPIALEEPRPGAEVASPVTVRGTVAVVPFESNLRGRVYDAAGQIVGEGFIMVQGSMGDPGPVAFAGQLAFSAVKGGPGKVEIADLSSRDGSVLASATVDVVLGAPAGTIEIPAAGAEVALPLHILARGGQPGDPIVAVLLWQDGTVLTRTYPLLEGEDGRGLLAESLWWQADVPPLPFPATQPATLEIRGTDGTVLARQEFTVVSWDDPDVQQVTVYFLVGEELQAVQRVVPRTPRIGAAALEELLWGPPPPNLAGLQTALPLAREVLAYPGRGPDWGPCVRLLELTIENGVATANFSRELKAYGGGSTRVLLIGEQITRTLQEFPTVQKVVIAVEGQTEGVLEP